MASRPRATAASISSRYGAHALAAGARPGDGGGLSRSAIPDGRAPGSVDTSLAGFAASWRCRGARSRCRPPAGRRWPSPGAPPSPAGSAAASSPTAQVPELAVVSRRPRCWPCWRKDHSPPAASTSWGAPTSLAGFQVSTTGRFWVSTEAPRAAGWVSRRAHPSRARGELCAVVVRVSSASGRAAGAVRSAREHDSGTRAGSSR